MNVTMAGLDPLVCLIYLNDIIVHVMDVPILLDRLRLLFDRLLATGLKLVAYRGGFSRAQDKRSGVSYTTLQRLKP